MSRIPRLVLTGVPCHITQRGNGRQHLMAGSSELGEGALLFQLRNTCPKSGTGLIGNYVVDLRSGRVWSDIDRQHEVDSKRLRRIRGQFNSKRTRKKG